jgi:tetratricopeptide (TPR) repeat protein
VSVDAFRRRRAVFLVVVVALVPFFGGVSGLVKAARSRRQQVAVDWGSRGDQDAAAGRADLAADDYRSAREYARDSNAYRFQLAQALAAANHPNEARGQLLALWAEAPADGVVNRELGRLAAHQGDTPEAVRFYHAAIDGAWQRDAPASRREARMELARYLLSKGEAMKAQAELIALIDDLPPDPAVMTDTAALLVKAGAAQRAMVVLDKALALGPHDRQALQLAGAATFALDQYRTAVRYFDAAAAQAPLDADDRRMRDLSARILTIDPFARGITSRERVRRVVGAFGVAASSLDNCPAASSPDLQNRVAQAKPRITERVLLHDADAVDDAIALLAEVESATAACSPAGPDDAALRLVLKQRRASS